MFPPHSMNKPPMPSAPARKGKGKKPKKGKKKPGKKPSGVMAGPLGKALLGQ